MAAQQGALSLKQVKEVSAASQKSDHYRCRRILFAVYTVRSDRMGSDRSKSVATHNSRRVTVLHTPRPLETHPISIDLLRSDTCSESSGARYKFWLNSVIVVF